MEKSNIKRLSKEVLTQGAEAALPCNLPDEWLNLIERDSIFQLKNESETVFGEAVNV